MNQRLKEFLLMTVGSVMTALGLYFFKYPNKLSTGGVSGIAILLNGIFGGLSTETISLILNIILLILGLIILGKSFTFKTVYCTVLISVIPSVLKLFDPLKYICNANGTLTDEPMLELIFAVLLPGIGSAILFNVGASSGGTDIIAMVIKKYTSMNISKALLISDFLIVMLNICVFRNAKIWLLSLVGFLSKVFVVNIILENINMSKYCTVITTREYEVEICRYITDTLHKSATVSEAYTGAYMHEHKVVILAALTRHQTVQLKKFVKSLDKKSFVVVCNTSEICGKGFRETI